MKRAGPTKLYVCWLTAIQVLVGLHASAADELGRRNAHPYLPYTDACPFGLTYAEGADASVSVNLETKAASIQ